VGVFYFAILVAIDMDWLPGDRGFLDRPPHGLHEVQVLLPRVGQVINRCWLQGTGVVTGNGDEAPGNRVEAAQAVDRGDNGIQSSKLTPVRVTFFHRARDSVVS